MFQNTLTKIIKQRRIDFKKRSDSETNNKVRLIRAEIVKLSFAKEPNLKRHRFLMAELEKIKSHYS